MKFSRNKKTSLIAIVIVLTISAMLVALPVVIAHDPAWNIITYTYVAVNANPIGIGQQTVIVYWVDKIMPTAVGQWGDRWQLSVEITKPL